jgi:hypothetical protein
MGRIKGTMKKRDRIRKGDTLFVTPWSFQDTMGDIFTSTPGCEITTVFNREPFWGIFFRKRGGYSISLTVTE